jgi:2'-5' RNA ligase
MRTFIAIELPQAIQDALRALTVRLQPSGGRVSWMHAENIHLTLRFLGEVDAEHVEGLAAILSDAYRGVTPFPLRVRGVGAFPNWRKPNVLWVGTEPLEGGLELVQTAAESAARAIGLPPESKPFHPHLTLVRVKDARTVGPLVESLQAEANFDAGEFQASGVTLFSSELRPKGPVYQRLREFPF